MIKILSVASVAPWDCYVNKILIFIWRFVTQEFLTADESLLKPLNDILKFHIAQKSMTVNGWRHWSMLCIAQYSPQLVGSLTLLLTLWQGLFSFDNVFFLLIRSFFSSGKMPYVYVYISEQMQYYLMGMSRTDVLLLKHPKLKSYRTILWNWNHPSPFHCRIKPNIERLIFIFRSTTFKNACNIIQRWKMSTTQGLWDIT